MMMTKNKYKIWWSIAVKWIFLKKNTNDNEKSDAYHMLGMVKNIKGEYQELVRLDKNYVKIKLETVTEDDILWANT